MITTNLAEDICSVTDFRSDIPKMLDKAKETHRPIVITQHGKSSAIVMNIHDYQELIESYEFMKTVIENKGEIEQGNFVTDEDADKMVFDS